MTSQTHRQATIDEIREDWQAIVARLLTSREYRRAHADLVTAGMSERDALEALYGAAEMVLQDGPETYLRDNGDGPVTI